MTMMPVRVRQNVDSLTAAQRATFVNALRALKLTRLESSFMHRQNPYEYPLSIYDSYVLVHKQSLFHRVHRSPWFLPWHRWFIWDLETALRTLLYSWPTLAIPYWDWANDGSGTAGAMWGADFMGGDGKPFPSGPPPPDLGGDVTTGPFRAGRWPLEFVPEGERDAPPTMNLRRGMGRNPNAPTLPSQADVDAVLGVAPYYTTESAPTQFADSFCNSLEGWVTGPGVDGYGLHNRVHKWVGGSMGDMPSPNDPVFYLHHANVDRIWTRWQAMHPDSGYLPTGPVPDPWPRQPWQKGWPRWKETAVGFDDPMWPWATGDTLVAPSRVWGPTQNLLYRYDTDWPVFNPAPPAARVPMTPVPADANLAANLLGPGWALARGTIATDGSQAVDSQYDPGDPWVGIGLVGPTTLNPSQFAASVSGGGPKALCQMYLCLSGPDAAVQRPALLQVNGGPETWNVFQGWDGSAFGGTGPLTPVTDRGKQYYWFRLQIPPLGVPPSGEGWVLWIANQNKVFGSYRAWAYLGEHAS